MEETKFDFGEDLQLKVLQLALQDHNWGRSVGLEIIESKFFDNTIYGKIFDWAKFLMEKYPNSQVTKANLKDCATKIFSDNRMTLQEKIAYDQVIDECYAPIDDIADGIDYVKDRALDFAKRQKFRQGIYQSAELMEKDPANYEKSIAIMEKALSVGSGLDMGLDLLRDMSRIPLLLGQKYDRTNMISSGLHGLDEVIGGGWIRGTLSLVGAPPGSGKAVNVKTKVLTPKGWEQAGEIKEGDYLIARDGTPTKVLKVFPQGIIKNYKVTFNDGFSTNCCPDHLWEVYDNANKKKKSVLTMQEILNFGLKHGKKNRWTIPTVDPVQFNDKQLPLHPYVLGVLMSTAGQINPEKYVKICVPTFDNHILEQIKEFLPEGVGLLPDNESEKPTYKLTDITIVEKALECLEMYRFGSVEQRKWLLQGLMDADGQFNKDTSVNRFYTSSDSLKNFVAELVQSLGGIVTVGSEKRLRDGITTYDHMLSIKINICPFTLPRKTVNWKAKKYSRSISQVEEQKDVKSVCFLVDNDEHLFVMEHYIVTHNTRCMSYFAAEALRQGKKVVFITLELDDIEILANIASALTGLTWWDMLSTETNKSEEYQQAVKEVESKILGGNLKTKFYINKSISSQAIISYLMRLKATENFIPDLVVVDYMDLLLPVAGAGSKGKTDDSNYDILGTVCFDLIKVAKMFHVPVVSGTQLGRSSWDLNGKEVISMASVSESAKKAFNAHNLITINRNPAEKELGKARFYTAKARTGNTGSVVYTNFDLAKCNIVEVDAYDPSDGPETEVTVKQIAK